jgi:hypothetical protein
LVECQTDADALPLLGVVGLPDPLAFFLVLACGRRSGNRADPRQTTSTASCHSASTDHHHARHVGGCGLAQA